MDFLHNPPTDAQGQPNYGYAITPTRERPGPRVCVSAPRVMSRVDLKDTVLWPALFEAWPAWSHGLQGTGDCVSWHWAHLLDIRCAVLAVLGKIRIPDALHCSEAIYGFGKAELFNAYRWNGQGMSGIDAAQATAKFGCLYRKQYSGFDLSSYSGSRAVAWGESPKSTHGVPDELESFALDHLAPDFAEVKTIDEAAKLIVSGFPFGYCGSTYWGTHRNSDGVAVRFDRGSHAMTCTGVRFDNGKPAYFWIANTGHGAHCTGPIGPYPMPSVYADCGSWIPVDRIEPVIADGDCYTCSIVGGWEPLTIPDWGFSSIL